MKPRYWKELVDSLQQGQCILVLGPEIEVEPPAGEAHAEPTPVRTCADWLAEYLTKQLKAEDCQVPEQTLMAVAQQYEDEHKFGATSLRSEAAQFYQSCGLRPSATHHLLARLPFTLILSTGHDDLLAQAQKDLGKTPLISRYHLRGRGHDTELPDLGSLDSPLIYHLFGSTDDPSSLVLSENDLLDFLIAVVSKNPQLPNSLIKALERPSNSFLFVGFGIRYWYLRVLLKVLVRALNLPSNSRQFAMESLGNLPQEARKEMILFYQRGTQIVLCDEPPVPKFLEELSARLEAKGGYKGPKPSSGKVFISYAREDQALAARLYSSLEQASFEPWFDKEALEDKGGVLWDEKIESDLRDTDFVLVLYTPALIRKRDGYVNKEIHLACRRADYVRGAFLIPLRTAELTNEERIEELRRFQDMPLREEQYEQDIGHLVSEMRREFKRRMK